MHKGIPYAELMRTAYLNDSNADSIVIRNLCDIIDRQALEIKDLTELLETVSISCAPPDYCNDPAVLKKYMKACFEKAEEIVK